VTVDGIPTVTVGVTVQIGGINHPAPSDLDILLVDPSGTSVVLMSDAGGQDPVAAIDLTFADDADGAVPQTGPLAAGAYRPTDIVAGTDSWPSPAPTPSGETALAAFNQLDPNGVWSLYVVAAGTGTAGSIDGGWCLTIDAIHPTETAIVPSANPSLVGEPVTFTATVTTTGGVPVTAGTVTFTDAEAPLAEPVAIDAQGRASLTTNTLTAGRHQIAATYNAEPGFLPTFGGLFQDVVADADTTSPAAGVWCNTGPIVLSGFGPAVPYPSRITVDGAGVTTEHTHPDRDRHVPSHRRSRGRRAVAGPGTRRVGGDHAGRVRR